MRALRFLAGLATALSAHILLVALAPEAARFVDPFLLLVAFHAMDGAVLAGVLAGVVSGLSEDALTGGIYGLHGFAATVVGYVAARAARVLTLQKSYYVGLYFASAVLVQQLVLQTLLLLLWQRPQLPTLGELSLRVVVAAPLGTLLVGTVGRFSESYRVWKARRPRVSLD